MVNIYLEANSDAYIKSWLNDSCGERVAWFIATTATKGGIHSLQVWIYCMYISCIKALYLSYIKSYQTFETESEKRTRIEKRIEKEFKVERSKQNFADTRRWKTRKRHQNAVKRANGYIKKRERVLAVAVLHQIDIEWTPFLENEDFIEKTFAVVKMEIYIHCTFDMEKK